MTETVDLSFLAKLTQSLLSEMKDMRREMTDVRRLTPRTVDVLRKREQRLDARMVAVRDDVELMIKSEVMGNLMYRDSIIEQKIEELGERVAAIEARWTQSRLDRPIIENSGLSAGFPSA
jgi:hypothetical protein